MTSVTEILPGVVVVEIPEGSWDHAIAIDDGKPILDYFKFGSCADGSVELPPGDYTFLFTTESMTEEQAGSVLTKAMIDAAQIDSCTYISEFHSALTSKGLDTDKKLCSNSKK